VHYEPAPGEDRTWHEADDETWGKRAEAAYAAAVRRDGHDDPALTETGTAP
jgi:hypothetical protein